MPILLPCMPRTDSERPIHSTLGGIHVSRRAAILGATWLVGQTMLRVLEEREFPTETPLLLASDSNRRTLRFRGRELPVEAVRPGAFDGVEIALFAVSNAISEQWAQVAQ